ncbi:RNA-binding ATPase activator esf2 [Tulasnella sp. 330]|nr:RNA-binding ATPase activator esf2 [Tulasnella sp. 330]KAG8875504.1 RNA-binding ATPase activator esf2 [Tulasnella sp. 331]KAG8884337.1 RNA-binding ATPase activator esf2 [Tulasnella sp. 332]
MPKHLKFGEAMGHVNDIGEQPKASSSKTREAHDDEDTLHASERDNDQEHAKVLRNKILKPITKEALEAFEATQKRAGVVYISRIPPNMRPQKIRQIMSQYGEVGRIYCTPEDAKRAYTRKKHTGNKERQYTEGWVEFVDKRIGRSVADMLNARPIGGKRGSRWKDDIWTMKYLPKFKWSMLTEHLAHEAAEHTARLRVELSQSRHEQSDYIRQVELAKSIEKRAASKQKKERKDGPGIEPTSTWSNVYEGPQNRPRVEKAGEESVVNDRKLKEIKNASEALAETYNREGMYQALAANPMEVMPSELSKVEGTDIRVRQAKEHMARLWSAQRQDLARFHASQALTRRDLTTKIATIQKEIMDKALDDLLQGEQQILDLKEQQKAQAEVVRLTFPRTMGDFDELHRLDQQDALQVAKYLLADGLTRSTILSQTKQVGKLWTEEDIAKLWAVFTSDTNFQTRVANFVKSKASNDPRKQ